MEDKNKITDEEYERIKKFVNRFSYVDLIAWRNQMIISGEINNRVYNLLDKEILRRENEINLHESKVENKSK